MHIGLITGEYPPRQGGVGDFSRELARALATLGHEVHIITRTRLGERASHSTKHEGPGTRSAQHIPSPVVPHWGWRSCWQLTDLACQLHLDVLNIQYQAAAYDLQPAINFYPFIFSLLLAWRRWDARSRPAVVVTFHDLKVPYLFPKAGPLRDWAVTLLARQADAAIVTNRADELALAVRNVDQVECIPIGSNIVPVLPDGYDRDIWRAQLQIEPEIFLLGFFGFFNARKGIETLIRALAALDPFHHVLFIGGTVGSSDVTNRAYADRMIALIQQLGLSDRVHFTGYVPQTEVSAAFAALDLCVLPYVDGISFHHGTFMAALAHGQPIVSTQPSLELPELAHGENVWLVPPKDVDALVAAITSLATNPIRRRQLAQGAADLSVQFGWERIAAHTVDLFESVKRLR
jgi:glycosyltransferase involved in cell wall biosynthesis